MKRAPPDDAAAGLVPAGGHAGQCFPLVRRPAVHVTLVVLVADPGDEDALGVDAGDAVVVLPIWWKNESKLFDRFFTLNTFQNNLQHPPIADLLDGNKFLKNWGIPQPCLGLERDPETPPRPS